MATVFALCVLLLGACSSDARVVEEAEPAEAVPFAALIQVASPDGKLRVELGLDELERPRYRIVRSTPQQEVTVLHDSTLGVETSFGSFATAGALEPVGGAELISDSFELPHGKARTSTVQARAQTVRAAELLIDFWVADTGVGFRYRLDGPDEPWVVDWERTSFAVPTTGRSWLQEHDAPGIVTPAYERLRSRAAPVTSPGRAPVGWTFPALFEADGMWTLITETALSDGAAGSHFSGAATDGEFLLDVAARGEGNGLGDPRPVATGSWTSPWRLIITSDDIGDLVESDLVRHLSPATTQNFDWIEPGRVSWSWWSDHESSKNGDAIEPFIDLAAQMGWEHSLVDANWNLFGLDRLAALVDYADERNVGLFVWYNSGGPNNAVTEAPRDRMADAATRQAEFRTLAEMGVRGVKVDFFQSDKPDTIQLYRDIMRDAAAEQLMVNFHGSTVPRGWSREFPNLMTMEAVRGAEIYTFDATFHRFAAWQNTVLPFTRNIVGPMDYTPVILGDHVRRLTTNGHELALSVVFESPLLHLVDTPQAYLEQPGEVIELLSTVPTVWDETRFIDGSPGTSVVIARRDGDTWWIGGINATKDSLVTAIDRNELGLGPDTDVLHVCDDPAPEADAASYLIVQGEMTSRTLALDLVPNGGCLVRLTPGS